MRNWIKRGVLSVFEQRDRNPRAVVAARRGEVHEVEVFMPFGLSYCPSSGVGSESVVFPAMGNNDLLFSPGFTGGDARPKADPGQSILYSGADGTQVQANPDGSVVITVEGGGRFTLSGGEITTNMNIRTSGDVVAGTISLKGHTHPVPFGQSGPPV